MTQHARVVSGEVVEILVPFDGHDFADCFPEAIVAECVDAPDEVRPGWAYDGKTFAAPAPVKDGKLGIRTIRGVTLVKALDKATKVSARDLAYVAALDAAREDMPSIIRIAGVDGLTARAWFDLALGVTG